MTRDDILNSYFEWLSDIVCGMRFARDISFRKLLVHLHNTEFIYLIAKDENRAVDGMHMRRRFAQSQELDQRSEYYILEVLDGPCSVFEMMIALAIHCEEHIMDDPKFGDRTGQWFWDMIANLGLSGQTDDRFDKRYVETTLQRFLNREYARDGSGGLFRVRHSKRDMRKAEIFHQLCWYLDTIN